jgi:hypothetical protein
MNRSLHDAFAAAALAGLVAGTLTACGGDAPPAADHGAKTEHAAKPEAKPEATPDATTAAAAPAAQPAGGASHACKGLNECKGQGGCAVPGQNECAGKNPCKAKGGCKHG